MRDSSLRIEGTSSFENMLMQYFDDLDVVVYVCVDASQTRVLDADGKDITPADRVDRVNLQVTFEIVDERLLLSRSEPWPSASSC